MGLSKQKFCRSYSSQYGGFPSFSFLFCLYKDANHILLTGLPGFRVTSHDAAAAALPAPAPTRSRHQDTRHPVCQGLQTDTGHPGGVTQQVGYLVTDGDKPDIDVPQKLVGLKYEACCGAPIPR